MKEKENVYVGTMQTEMGVMTQAGQEKETNKNAAPENVSTDLGKFRSVDALLRAYEALESEFTRRSQRLKELEREADNSLALAEGGRGVENGAEKLRKNAAQKREKTKDFDRFVSELESVRAQTEKTPESQVEQPEIPIIDGLEQDAWESEIGIEQTIAKPSVAGGRGEESLSDDALYELVKKDEKVRLKIIGEYLNSIGKSGAPLMKGGTGTLVAPPLKPKNIVDAGNMALRFFKKESV